METKVRTWYQKKHKGDPEGKHLGKKVTFADLLAAMQAGADVYDVLGAADSVVRERVFAALARRSGKRYSDIYSLWLAPTTKRMAQEVAAW